MVKFDNFTAKYLKFFFDKRSNYILPGLKDLKRQVSKSINTNINYKIEDYTISLSKINKLADTEWVDQDILNNLDPLTKNKKISWTYKKIDHNIYIKTTVEKFSSLQDRLVILLNMLNFLYDQKEIKEERPINMYLVLSSLKKQLIDEKFIKTNTIDVKNVNSGYTDFIVNEIFIWREEEFEKVIFHEMVHYMDLDVRNMAFSDKDLPHDINGPKSYYEAFTDVWANIYHLIYLSLLTKKSVDSLFQIEFQFIKNQANLFNNVFELKDWSKRKVVKQNTPAFTYYILKYLIFEKIIKAKTLDILKQPKELLTQIFSERFKENSYFNVNSTRMTLIQIK